MDTKLNNGDVVELGDGSAIEEPSETAEESIPYSIEEEGRGLSTCSRGKAPTD